MFGPKNRIEAEISAIVNLLAETQYCIQSVMGRKNVNRSELADRLGCSPSNVTQMLSEDSNLTLDSVARIFHALGDTCTVKSEFLEGKKGSVAVKEGAVYRAPVVEIHNFGYVTRNKPMWVGQVQVHADEPTRRAGALIAQAANNDSYAATGDFPQVALSG